MDVYDVLKSLGMFGVATCALVWLLIALLKQVLAHDIAGHKASLKRAHDLEIERLRADLRAAAFEHETRFARLHEKRAEVIAELYKRLVDAQREMAFAVSPVGFSIDPPIAEKAQRAASTFDSLNTYFREMRLYLPREVGERIDDFLSRLRGAWEDFSLSPEIRGYDKVPNDPEGWEKAWKKLTKETPPILRKIEDEFRGMLEADEKPDPRKSAGEN